MRRDELDELVGWAADEGWNPGLGDAALFWDTDPEGFVAAEHEETGALIGGGSIVSYDGLFGFMGFFIVEPAWRGRGIGSALWHHRRDALRARLRPDAAIGMDGVPAMQPFYRRGGFVSAGTDVRYEGPPLPDRPLAAGLVDARDVPLDDLAAYDALHFPAPRPGFVRRWIAQTGARALAARADDGHLTGYGVVRPCGRGHKVGPLFAADPATAALILDGLSAHAAARGPEGPLVLDVPDANPAAVALARDRGMVPVFECARMYLGPAPAIPLHEVFGVTTFELG
ncbi:MAG: GNAT family N-acetyltransferase [Thermoleophilia bacterium]